MAYTHLFFDLDHTLWDFETNSKETIKELFASHRLAETITEDFELFFEKYSYHNKRLWHRYNNGFIKQDELKWKRMWHALLEFKLADESLAKRLSSDYLEVLPHKKALFPYTIEILDYLAAKKYQMHLITNGFDKVQGLKIANAGIDRYFTNIVTSETACSLKPHKEIFAFAIARANCCYEESIMIGDNLDADITGAMNAGMDTIFVNHINEEPTVKPTYVIYHLKELEELL